MKNLKQSLADAGWEVFEDSTTLGVKVIRPLRKAEKQEYNLWFYHPSDASIIENTYKFTPTQAEKVATALEAVMEFLTKDILANTNYDNSGSLIEKLYASREALRSTE